MALFRRRSRPGTVRTANSADTDHLTAFATTRSGVEGYVEPRTAVTETTLVLVAATGEWTRRRVGGEHGAATFARKHGIPLYEVAKVGYPQRMRDWTEQRKRAGEVGPPSSR
ncbi:MAG: oxidoreductase [Actinobacteria bacterium]|nr:oxidoreductase [Actinomycetota bacterium]